MARRRRKRRPLPSPKLIAVLIVALVSSVFLGSSTVSQDSKPNYNAAMTRAVGKVSGTQGTLRLGSSTLCDSFDPALSFDQWCGVITRLYSRNLMSFAGSAGQSGLEVVPDLVDGPPAVSDDKVTWSFHLQEGVKWNDGTPVTSADVRFAIERLYDPAIVGSVSYATLCLLSPCSTGLPDFKGPYGGRHLKSLSTPDDQTVAFTLTRPYALFANVLALPQFAPIEAAREQDLYDQKRSYASGPASSGPFTISIAKDGSSVTFKRNTHWDQATDGIRSPQVSKMVWTVYSKDSQVDDALLKGEIDVKLDGGLGKTGREAIAADANLRAHTDQPPTGAVDYLSLIPNVQPMDRIACREAIMYALDKSDLVKLRGGPEVLRQIGNMSSPTLPGGTNLDDPYPTGATGSLEAARRKLVECGYPDGFEINMAYVKLGTGQATYESVQRSLARIGIVVDPLPYDSFASYFNSGVGSPGSVKDNEISIIATSWSPEGSSSVAYWGPIADGRKVVMRGNVNYSQFNNDAVNALIDRMEAGTARLSELNVAVDKTVMASAQYLPYGRDQLLLYRGQQLTNVYVQWALGGQYDIASMGLRAVTP